MTAPVLSPDDRWALTDLVHRYAALADDRAATALADLFLADGVLVSPDPPRELAPVHEARGHEAIATAITGLSALRLTVHAVAGIVLDPQTDDHVRGRTTATAHHVTEHDGALRDVVWHLRYLDDFRRTPHGWRIARRELHLDLIESRSVAHAREAR